MAVKQRVEVEDRSLALSNLEKPLYRDGFTKAQVIDDYIRIASWLLPHYARRPITMKRFPDGVRGKAFSEKDAPKHTPDWIHTMDVPARQTESQSGIPALTICRRSSGARTSRAWNFIRSSTAPAGSTIKGPVDLRAHAGDSTFEYDLGSEDREGNQDFHDFGLHPGEPRRRSPFLLRASMDVTEDQGARRRSDESDLARPGSHASRAR